MEKRNKQGKFIKGNIPINKGKQMWKDKEVKEYGLD